MISPHPACLAPLQVPPTTFHKDLYPSYVIDDANRPKVFDCHLLQVTGYLLWPFEDSQHLELHVEHNSIRLYSHRQITQYRTQHANITGENLVVAPRAKGSKKPNSKRGVTAAIVRSIYHDVHAFSPTSTVALPGQPTTEPGKAPALSQVNPQANANLPLLPLSLDFSLRDVTQLWLDTAFRHIAHITFQSGFALVRFSSSFTPFVELYTGAIIGHSHLSTRLSYRACCYQTRRRWSTPSRTSCVCCTSTA